MPIVKAPNLETIKDLNDTDQCAVETTWWPSAKTSAEANKANEGLPETKRKNENVSVLSVPFLFKAGKRYRQQMRLSLNPERSASCPNSQRVADGRRVGLFKRGSGWPRATV